MKRIVLVFGGIAGVLNSLFMVSSMAYYYSSSKFEGSMVLGFSAMILSFSLIFVGIKKWRDEQNDGSVSFGKGFLIGLYISLIASTMYVVSWMIEYHFFMPDFMEKYMAFGIEQVKASGGSQIEIAAKQVEMEPYKKMYENPLQFALITYTEILPVGIVVSIISALILKKNPKVV